MGLDITLRNKKAEVTMRGYIEVSHFSEDHVAEVIAILLGVRKELVYEMSDEIGIVGIIDLRHVIERLKLLEGIYCEPIAIGWTKESGDVFATRFEFMIGHPEHAFFDRLNEFVKCLVVVGMVDINDVYMSWG